MINDLDFSWEDQEVAPIISLENQEAVNVLKAKGPNLVKMMKEIDGSLEDIKGKIKKLQAEKKKLEDGREMMESKLIEAIKATGLLEVESDEYIFALKKKGGIRPLKIIEGEVPDGYQKLIMEPDKEKIRKALENGEELEFAYLEEKGLSLKVTPINRKKLDLEDVEW